MWWYIPVYRGGYQRWYVKYKQTPNQSENVSQIVLQKISFPIWSFSQQFFSYFFFLFICLCFSSWCIKCFLYVYSINEYKKMDILTCCLLSKRKEKKKTSHSFSVYIFSMKMLYTRTTNNFEWMESETKKKTFHFISIPCTLLHFGRYIDTHICIDRKLADMSFIFVFNTVEEAFSDDWIFRYFLLIFFSILYSLSLDVLRFCLIAHGILAK